MSKTLKCKICENVLMFEGEYINIHIKNLCIDCYKIENPDKTEEEMNKLFNEAMNYLFFNNWINGILSKAKD
jgi:hypothetical protein